MEPQEVISIARNHIGSLEATHIATGINTIVLRQALRLINNGIPAIVDRYKNNKISLRLAYKISALSHKEQAQLMDLDAKTFRLVMGQLGFLKDCEGMKRQERVTKQLLS